MLRKIIEQRENCVVKKPQNNEKLVLPFECTSLYLSTHPLILKMKCNVREVHECIMRLLHQEESSQRVEDDSTGVPYPNRCVECNGYLETDHSNGDIVCDECGVVTSSQVFDVPYSHQSWEMTEWDSHSSDWEAQSRGAQSHGTRSQEATRSSKRAKIPFSLLEHWNYLVNLPKSDLNMCKHRAEKLPNVSMEAQIAGLLVMKDVSDQLALHGFGNGQMPILGKCTKDVMFPHMVPVNKIKRKR